MKTDQLVENFFRHEYGRLVAILTSRVGAQHLAEIEDAVQSALSKACEIWARNEPPENPSAWLFRVAHRDLIGALRQNSRRSKLLHQHLEEILPQNEEAEMFLPEEVRDDLLTMLFICCDDAIPEQSQLVLALKTLCGFSNREIALRLFSEEASIRKRLNRAQQRLRDSEFSIVELSSDQYSTRLQRVQRILYLIFTEGYLSSDPEIAIRKELCQEAIRLTTILSEHTVGETPETFALRALMHFQNARLTSRQGASGGILLLEEQNRTRWDQDEIQRGLEWLARSATGDHFSRYHAEAGIAAEHCLAPSFEETRWDRVIECYELLERVTPSAIHRLNRAVATAEWSGAGKGLALLKKDEFPKKFTNSYMWAAVLSDLHRRSGDLTEADRHRERAIRLAPTPAIKELLKRRLILKS